MKKINFLHLEIKVYCDVSSDNTCIRPYVPANLHRSVFNALHGLSHPGIKATQRLVTKRFVWPSINKDYRKSARCCIPCQHAKVTRHITSPVEGFSSTGGRFEHIHVDIVGPLSSSLGCRYCITIVNRFTRWPEAIPVLDIEAIKYHETEA